MPRRHSQDSKSSSDHDPDLWSERPTETIECGSPSTLVVGLDCRSMNLYRFLRVRFPDLQRPTLQQWMAEGRVSLNGSLLHDSRPLRAGDVIDIAAAPAQAPSRRGQVPPRILFQDEHLVAVHKPAGMADSPQRQDQIDHLGLWLQRQDPDGPVPKLAHRLDKPASGVVVFARSRDVRQTLVDDFSEGLVQRDYLALTTGEMPPAPRLLRTLHSMSKGRTPRAHVRGDHGKEAVTLLRVAWPLVGYSVVHARPLTARTHQVRAHLESLGHPCLGDKVYGGLPELYLSEVKIDYQRSRGERERPLLDRLALHLARLTMPHPVSREPLRLEAPLPADLAKTIKRLQKFAGRGEAEDFQKWLAQAPSPPDEDPFAGLGGTETNPPAG